MAASPTLLAHWCHSCRRVVCARSSRLNCPLCGFEFLEELGELNQPSILVIGLDGRSRLSSNRNTGHERGFWRRFFGTRSRRAADPVLQIFDIISLVGLGNTNTTRHMPGILQEDGGNSGDSGDMRQGGNGSTDTDVPASVPNISEEVADSGVHNGTSSRNEHDTPRRHRFSRLADVLRRRNGSRHSPTFHGMRAMFLGPAFNILMQQLAVGEATRYGSLPASKAAVEAMPTLEISKQSLEMGEINCAICKEDFDVGGKVREMPCKHLYHPHCILPWLALHSSCPLCRYEMPTEEETQSQPRAAESEVRFGGQGGESDNGHERSLVIMSVSDGGFHMLSVVLIGVRSGSESAQQSQEAHVPTAASGGVSATAEDTSNEMNMVINLGLAGEETEGTSLSNSVVSMSVPHSLFTGRRFFQFFLRGNEPSSSTSSFRNRTSNFLSWLSRHGNPFRASRGLQNGYDAENGGNRSM